MAEFKGFYSAPLRQLIATPQLLKSAGLWPTLFNLQASVPADEKHWEFVATAVLHTAGFPAPNSVTPLVREALENLLSRMKPGHRAANWRLMRFITEQALAGRCVGVPDLARLGMAQHADGFLPDAPGDDSTQYHAYNSLLLARFADASDTAMRATLESALVWLYAAHRTDGEPNARGRGKFQLFGYACMWALADLLERRWGMVVSKHWRDSLARRLGRCPESGALPAWWQTPVKHASLLGYNSVDDYPAFADFWAPGQGFSPSTPSTLSAPTDAPVHYSQYRLVRTAEGSCVVFSEQDGPVLALQSVAAPAKAPTLRSTVKALLRLASTGFKRRAEPSSLPSLLGASSVEFHGWRLCAVEGRLTVQWTLAGQVAQAPVLWTREDLVPLSAATANGSLEASHLQWQVLSAGEFPAKRWHGLSLHAVRAGSYRLELSVLRTGHDAIEDASAVQGEPL